MELPSMSVSGISDVLWSLSILAAAALFNLCSSHLSDMTMYARPITTGICKEAETFSYHTRLQVRYICS